VRRFGTATKLAVGLGLIATAVVLIGVIAVGDAFDEEYKRFERIRPGMTESQVLALLGKPERMYEKGSAPKDYYIKGYAFKERPITNKVYVYVGKEPIAYIYFDNQNKVEEAVVGGS
jgi:outer membrane protein assembly factor BamE (lipoprotein component of BamABCDE complex)